MTQPLPDPVDFDTATALLRAGEVCAFGTETVYGLGADATSDAAVLKIYATKDRPRFNPLIVHCADLDMAQRFAHFSRKALKLANTFWPGPLTLVLPRRADAGLADLVTAGLDTVALRVPDHALARALIRAVGKPLAAPSANPSGKLTTTSADAVIEAFGGIVPVLDGGPCRRGLESTIVGFAADQPVQLRAGAVARDEIEQVMGAPVGDPPPDGKVQAPGMLLRHYAPKASLRLDAEAPAPGEAWLGFGPDPARLPALSASLSVSGDMEEAARNLFAMLRQLDAAGAQKIAVAAIPDTGLGEAINDRLRRAARG
jgi:L-threonylcarbamoyladenylate synthase